VFTVFDGQVAKLPPAELQTAIHGLLQKAAARPAAGG
jgi:hypothetical protein